MSNNNNFSEPSDSDIMGFFTTMLRDNLSSNMVSRDWSPKTDIIGTDDSIIVMIELPSVDEKSINIDVFNNKLTISGQKIPMILLGDEVRVSKKEIKYGNFSRT